MPDNQEREWNGSYERHDNFLFHPHEEIIRFVSRNIRKRVGFHEFIDVDTGPRNHKLLDLGCGIGRHVIFAHQMGLDAYGVDLSARAVAEAVGWASREGVPDADNRIVCSDLRKLPWPDATFDYVISHGVLDSMHFAVARKAITETARVMASGGLFYCDLISGDDSSHSREFAGEETTRADNRELRPGGFNTGAHVYRELTKLIREYDDNRFLNQFQKVFLVKGDAVQTIPAFIAENPHLLLSLLFLDFDLYEPTKAALDHFLPRMSKGAILAFDEINSERWPGETQALLESMDLRQHRIRRFTMDPNIAYIIL